MKVSGGRAFWAERTVSAKALGPEYVWHVSRNNQEASVAGVRVYLFTQPVISQTFPEQVCAKLCCGHWGDNVDQLRFSAALMDLTVLWRKPTVNQLTVETVCSEHSSPSDPFILSQTCHFFAINTWYCEMIPISLGARTWVLTVALQWPGAPLPTASFISLLTSSFLRALDLSVPSAWMPFPQRSAGLTPFFSSVPTSTP